MHCICTVFSDMHIFIIFEEKGKHSVYVLSSSTRTSCENSLLRASAAPGAPRYSATLYINFFYLNIISFLLVLQHNNNINSSSPVSIISSPRS